MHTNMYMHIMKACLLRLQLQIYWGNHPSVYPARLRLGLTCHVHVQVYIIIYIESIDINIHVSVYATYIFHVVYEMLDPGTQVLHCK